MCLLFREGFGGGVGGRRLSSAAAIRKFFASTYSYVELIILVVFVMEPVGLSGKFGFQSMPYVKLVKSVESRVFAGNGGGMRSSSDVESVVSVNGEKIKKKN